MFFQYLNCVFNIQSQHGILGKTFFTQRKWIKVEACIAEYVRIPSTHNEIFFRDTVQITFIFIDFRVCDFAFAFKTQNAPCVSRFKRVLFSDRFQFAF